MSGFQASSPLRAALWLILPLACSCTLNTGMGSTEPSGGMRPSEQGESDEQQPADGDLGQFSTPINDAMLALDPPDNPPQPLEHGAAEQVRLTCEDRDRDGHLISMDIDGGEAVVQVASNDGQLLAGQRFQLDSALWDEQPRYWFSGPDIQIAYTAIQGCAGNIRVRASTDGEAFRYVFPACRTHDENDEHCRRR